VLTRDDKGLPVTNTFIHKWNEPNLPLLDPQPQSITALWLVLIFRPAEGRRLSWTLIKPTPNVSTNAN